MHPLKLVTVTILLHLARASSVGDEGAECQLYRESCRSHPEMCGAASSCGEWLRQWVFQQDVDPTERSTQRSVLWRTLAGLYPPGVQYAARGEAQVSRVQLDQIENDLVRTPVDDPLRLQRLLIEYTQSHLPDQVYIQGINYIAAAVMSEKWATDEDVYNILWALLEGINPGYSSVNVPLRHVARLLRYVGLNEAHERDMNMKFVSTLSAVISLPASLRVLDIALVLGQEGLFAFHIGFFKRYRTFGLKAQQDHPRLPLLEALPNTNEQADILTDNLNDIIEDARKLFALRRDDLRAMTERTSSRSEIIEWTLRLTMSRDEEKDNLARRLELWAGGNMALVALPAGDPPADVDQQIDAWMASLNAGDEINRSRDKMRTVLRAYSVAYPANPPSFSPLVGSLLKPIAASPLVNEATAFSMLTSVVATLNFLDPNICRLYLEFIDSHSLCSSAVLFPNVPTCPLLLPFTVDIPVPLAQLLLDIGSVLGQAGWFAIYVDLALSLQSATTCAPVRDIPVYLAGFARVTTRDLTGYSDRIHRIYATMRPMWDELIETGTVDDTSPSQASPRVLEIHPLNTKISSNFLKFMEPSSPWCAATFSSRAPDVRVDRARLLEVPGFTDFRPCRPDPNVAMRSSPLITNLVPHLSTISCDSQMIFITCIFNMGPGTVELNRRTVRGDPLSYSGFECTDTVADSAPARRTCDNLFRSYTVLQTLVAEANRVAGEMPIGSSVVDSQVGTATGIAREPEHRLVRLAKGNCVQEIERISSESPTSPSPGDTVWTMRRLGIAACQSPEDDPLTPFIAESARRYDISTLLSCGSKFVELGCHMLLKSSSSAVDESLHVWQRSTYGPSETPNFDSMHKRVCQDDIAPIGRERECHAMALTSDLIARDKRYRATRPGRFTTHGGLEDATLPPTRWTKMRSNHEAKIYASFGGVWTVHEKTTCEGRVERIDGLGLRTAQKQWLADVMGMRPCDFGSPSTTTTESAKLQELPLFHCCEIEHLIELSCRVRIVSDESIIVISRKSVLDTFALNAFSQKWAPKGKCPKMTRKNLWRNLQAECQSMANALAGAWTDPIAP